MNFLNSKNLLGLFSVLILIFSGGSVPFIFLRKAYLFFVFFLFLVLVFKDGITSKELRLLIQLSIGTLVFLGVNYVFAVTEQSFQKLLANLVIFLSGALGAVFFARKENQYKFTEYLYMGLKLIMLHSLLSAVAYPFLKSSLFLASNWHYECSTFYYLFYYLPEKYSTSLLGISIIRNQGVFWEPGILQVFLNILIFLEAFVFKRSKTVLVFTVIAIFTTLSTTGLVILFVFALFYFKDVLKRNILLFPLAIIGLIFMYIITTDNVTDKVFGEGTTSYQVRLFDLVQPLGIVMQHPLTGVGLDDQQYIELRNSISYAMSLDELNFTNIEKGSTNSIMFFLAATGIPATILILIMLYKQTFIVHKRKLFFLLLILSLMTEPLLLKPIFIIFAMSGGIVLLNKFK